MSKMNDLFGIRRHRNVPVTKASPIRLPDAKTCTQCGKSEPEVVFSKNQSKCNTCRSNNDHKARAESIITTLCEKYDLTFDESLLLAMNLKTRRHDTKIIRAAVKIIKLLRHEWRGENFRIHAMFEPTEYGTVDVLCNYNRVFQLITYRNYLRIYELQAYHNYKKYAMIYDGKANDILIKHCNDFDVEVHIL